MKTVTLKARAGNPPPRLAETASGMLNSIGLENAGLDGFLKEKLPFLKKLKVPVIASIAGDDKNEFRELARRLGRIDRIDALELNLSCPNLLRVTSHGLRVTNRYMISQDEKAAHEVIRAVRKATRLAVIAKLTPNVTDITKMARSAEEGGADAVLLANTFPAMAIDIESMRPALGNTTGGLSGPAVKPMVLKMVWDTYGKIGIPIIASGGIMDYRDAAEYLLAGAAAVQVGTATFVDPEAACSIVKGLESYLGAKKMDDINRLIGAARR
jgi:dihydroorotate dehydrogenase (NAD+) catalytic subunit